MPRCPWANDELYWEYHDREWGVPSHDDRHLFEMLILEGAQAGLSWITILRKREAYRRAFDGFDARKIAKYGAPKKRALLKRTRRWLSTQGRILESTLYKDPGRNATHFRIRYEFSVGERIEGSTPRIAGDWFWNNKQQAAFVARFTPGQKVEVFYDPRDPKQNRLPERGWPGARRHFDTLTMKHNCGRTTATA